MIVINITTKRGVLLGQTELTTDDIDIKDGEVTRQSKEWVGEKILMELPSHTDTLIEYLEGTADAGD